MSGVEWICSWQGVWLVLMMMGGLVIRIMRRRRDDKVLVLVGVVVFWILSFIWMSRGEGWRWISNKDGLITSQG